MINSTLILRIMSFIIPKKFKITFAKQILQKEYQTKSTLSKFPFAVFAWDHIGLNIFLDGIYEKKILENLENYLRKNNKIKNCLDIGANIGNHSIAFSKYFEKVYSFEPAMNIFSLLTFNTQNYTNIEIFNFGLSDEDTVMELFQEHSNYGHSTLERDDNKKYQSAEKIELRKFDNIISFKEIEIDFIKIDVEGHELQVLKGASSLLENLKPIIGFEKNTLNNDVYNFLSSKGYKYYYDAKNNFKKIEDWNKNYSMIVAQTFPRID